MSDLAPLGVQPRSIATELVREALRHVATTAASITHTDARGLTALRDAIERAVAGEEPRLAAPPPHAGPLLAAFRRSFVDLLRSSPGRLEVPDVARILDAVERVRDVLDRDTAANLEERVADPGALDLVIEVAHDLRSPLTSILYLAETLRAGQSGPVQPLQEHQLALIYTAAFELSALANDLTELGHGGAQLLERRPVPFSIETLLTSVCDIVMPIAEEKGLEVRVVREAADRRRGHPAALGRVLLNLVTNALRCTSRGFVEVGAHDREAAHTEFTVRDTGPGMSAEAVGRLFATGGAGRVAHARGFSSSGLGLSICRRLLAAMGAELRVTTAPERGSCFYFEVPLPAAGPHEMLETVHEG